MIARLIGAGLRAFLVALLIAAPTVIVPGIGQDMSQMIALFALFGAMLTIVEYASTYPSFLEFRDAPPFNRLRFASLALTMILLALITRGTIAPNLLTEAATGLSLYIGGLVDFPFSPVRLLLLALPETTPVAVLVAAKAMAGLAFVILLMTVALFWACVRYLDWPSNSGAFNFWVNLPLFDPTAGGDVLNRLRRDSQVNIVLGVLLPFLVPAALNLLSLAFGFSVGQNPQNLIWVIAPWAFLPTSLLMRGLALSRIASMIEEKRRRAYAQADALQAA